MTGRTVPKPASPGFGLGVRRVLAWTAYSQRSGVSVRMHVVASQRAAHPGWAIIEDGRVQR